MSVQIKQLVLSKRLARQLPKVSSDGDHGFKKEQVLGGKAVCWAWAEDIEWRNGTGIAILVETTVNGQNVWIHGGLLEHFGGKAVIPFAALI